MGAKSAGTVNRDALNRLYRMYNRRELIAPDPLELLYRFDDPADREVAALVASALAYGRVTQIVRNASAVLDAMGSPARFLEGASLVSLRRRFAGFRHRFTTGNDLTGILMGARQAVAAYGSLEACFADGLGAGHETVMPAIEAFVKRLTVRAGHLRRFLLPLPSGGSACKRMNLFLRWMVRRDDVDPGHWRRVPPSKLVVPLDTHMHRICRALGLTARKQADLRAALEVTAAFRAAAPEDPARYDFALTRLGMRGGVDLDLFLREYRLPEAA